jgi:hypothetical protein
MRKSQRDRAFYAGALYFEPAFRESGLSGVLLGSVAQFCSTSNTVLMTQSNFRGFDRFVEKCFLNPKIVEFIKYDEEELLLPENTEKCFKVLTKLDGIRFYTDMP